jgi:hypothetical protein
VGDNLGCIFRRYLEITAFLRMINDNGTPLTKPMTTGLADVNFVTQALLFNLRFNTRRDFFTAGSLAPGRQIRNTG